MNSPVLPEGSLVKRVLDAMPAMVFLMDRTVQVVGANRAAGRAFGRDHSLILRRLCGEALHCINALRAPEGCGTTEFCSDCVVRKGIAGALEGGLLFREAYRMSLDEAGTIRERWFLVTASRLEHDGAALALLSLEDVTELYELRRIVPICSGCRKARDDQDFWQHVDTYLSKHTGLRFTHGLCPECIARLYPDYADRINRPDSSEEVGSGS